MCASNLSPNPKIRLITTLHQFRDKPARLKDLLKRQLQVTASKIYLWVEVRNIPENLSFGFTQTINCSFAEKKPQEEYDKAGNVKLDETDLQIVEELTKDGRAPFGKIAQSIGSSTDTVNRRYVRLLQNGFIKVSIQVDPILLGYRAAVSFFIDFLCQNETGKGNRNSIQVA